MNNISKFTLISLSVFNLSYCECMDIMPTMSIDSTSSVRLEALQQANINMTDLASANQEVMQQILAELRRKNDIEEEKLRIERERTETMEAELEKQRILKAQELDIEQKRIAAIAQSEAARIAQQQQFAEQQRAAEATRQKERNNIVNLLSKQRQQLADYQNGNTDQYRNKCPSCQHGPSFIYHPCTCTYNCYIYATGYNNRLGYFRTNSRQQAITKLTAEIATTEARLGSI